MEDLDIFRKDRMKEGASGSTHGLDYKRGLTYVRDECHVNLVEWMMEVRTSVIRLEV